jgi:hypothetical protein
MKDAEEWVSAIQNNINIMIANMRLNTNNNTAVYGINQMANANMSNSIDGVISEVPKDQASVSRNDIPRDINTYTIHCQHIIHWAKDPLTSLNWYRDVLNTTITDEELYIKISQFYDMIESIRP